jgi:hypothetical protein
MRTHLLIIGVAFVGLFALGIGATPRMIEELQVGGGYGNTGVDIEADGDVLMDGDLVIDGAIVGGISTTGNLTVGDDLTVTGGDITVGDGGTISAPVSGNVRVQANSLHLYRDNTGSSCSLFWIAKNDAAEEVHYNRLYGYVSDDTDGSEDGRVYIQEMVDGSLTTVWDITSPGDGWILGDYTVKGGDIYAGVTGTTRGTVTAYRGTSTNTPGTFVSEATDGDEFYAWASDDGIWRSHSSLPTANTDGYPIAGREIELNTFNSSYVTSTSATISVTGESLIWLAATSSHNVETLSNPTSDQCVRLINSLTGTTKTIKHNTGNIYLAGEADIALEYGEGITLVYSTSMTKWFCMDRN